MRFTSIVSVEGSPEKRLVFDKGGCWAISSNNDCAPYKLTGDAIDKFAAYENACYLPDGTEFITPANIIELINAKSKVERLERELAAAKNDIKDSITNDARGGAEMSEFIPQHTIANIIVSALLCDDVEELTIDGETLHVHIHKEIPSKIREIGAVLEFDKEEQK